jgi:hypothetical protein
MTEYILLIPDNEAAWMAATEEQRQAVYGQHRAFAEALASRGHTLVNGAELAPVAQTRTVRKVDGAISVTEGPYAESVEQLSGYYLIETSDVDDLVDCVGILADAESGLELRECLKGGS